MQRACRCAVSAPANARVAFLKGYAKQRRAPRVRFLVRGDAARVSMSSSSLLHASSAPSFCRTKASTRKQSFGLPRCASGHAPCSHLRLKQTCERNAPFSLCGSSVEQARWRRHGRAAPHGHAGKADVCHLPADDPEECRLVARDRVPTFLPLGLLAHLSEARVRQRAGHLHARALPSMSPPPDLGGRVHGRRGANHGARAGRWSVSKRSARRSTE